jgi:hypothetical protein
MLSLLSEQQVVLMSCNCRFWILKSHFVKLRFFAHETPIAGIGWKNKLDIVEQNVINTPSMQESCGYMLD